MFRIANSWFKYCRFILSSIHNLQIITMRSTFIQLIIINMSLALTLASKEDADLLYNKIFTTEGQPLPVHEVYKSLAVLVRFYHNSDEFESLIKTREIEDILETAYVIASKCNVDTIQRINWLIRKYRDKVNILPLLEGNRADQLRICYEEGITTKNGRRKTFNSFQTSGIASILS